MAKPRNLLFKSCSVLLAALFAISTLAQFDDPDWYFWIPLYAAACLVNLVNGVSKYKRMRQIAKLALLLGLFLLIKLFIQDFVQGIAGFRSLNMREKVVREKIGSGIVIISMFLQLQASSEPYKVNKATGSNNVKVGTYVEYGVALLVGISYGTTFGLPLCSKRASDEALYTNGEQKFNLYITRSSTQLVFIYPPSFSSLRYR